MTEATVDLKTPDGVMSCHTFNPGGGERYPAVIFYMDGFGIRPTLMEMARRIASNGYYVALPNLFYRAGQYKPFEIKTVFSNPAERERLMVLVNDVTIPRAMQDTAVVLDHLGRQPEVGQTARIGAVGYCMGGGPALSSAGTFPDRVFAAASYHGGRLATDAPDSPHLLAAKSRGRLYIGFAEKDQSFPVEQQKRLEKALTDGHVRFTMQVYKAAHGFAVADTPAYDQEAADRHWQTMLRLYRECLSTDSVNVA